MNFKFQPIQERPQKFNLSSWQKKILKTTLIVGSVCIIFLALLITGLLIQGQTKFDISKINLEITGPETTESSAQITYKIKYSNNSAITITNLKLVLDYPENFTAFVQKNIFEKDFLNPSEKHEIEIQGRLLGNENSKHQIKATLYYKPENFKSQFKKQADFTTLINSSSILLLWQGPNKVSEKQKIDLELSYLNKQESIFGDFQIQIILPKDFELEKSNPKPDKQESEKLIYFIGALEKDDLEKIQIQGIINQESKFRAELGVIKNNELDIYAQKEHNTSLVQIQANISQTINSQENYIANPGETLNYVLTYENPDDLLIPSANVICALTGQAFDLNSVQVKNGNFNLSTQEIAWDNIQIAPQKKASVKFSVKLKDQMPIQDFNDKNFSATTLATLETENFNTSNELEVKINSQVDLQAKAYYNEQSVDIQNSGPIPPRVGQATTYTIHWQITNGANALENVVVKAGLPANTRYTNKNHLSSGRIFYNQLSNELIWTIDNLSAHTGKLAPLEEAVFQIELIPAKERVGKFSLVLDSSFLSTQDAFTKNTLNDSQGYLDTISVSKYDSSVDADDGIIVE